MFPFRTLLLAALLLLPLAAEPYRFRILTEEYPPLNYMENGKVVGITTEIVREILRRTGDEGTFRMLPWSRAYTLTLQGPETILYTTSRIPQREDLFWWVGPVNEARFVLFAKKGSGIRLNDLEAAKKIRRIGTYRNDVCELYLKSEGFTNLESVVNDEVNLQKLILGRIDLWASSGIKEGLGIADRLGYRDVIEPVLTYHGVEDYIAFSKDVPRAVVARWQKALDGMKQDGTYQKIHRKYAR